MEKLTSQQEKMLDKIKQYLVKRGYAPTVRELCQEMNLSSTATVQVHLNNLEKDYPNVYEIEVREGTDKKCIDYAQITNVDILEGSTITDLDISGFSWDN